MKTVAVRVREHTQRTLRELAAASGQTVPQVLEKAVEQYRRQQFLEGLSADFGALAADRAAWDEELQERRLWEGGPGPNAPGETGSS